MIDNDIIDYKTLYGSWAGAFGNFQFMPTTIKKYALDYDRNNQINLKSIEDSFASAANYINSIGWINENPCFIKVDLNKNIPVEYLNTSAKKIKSKKKFKHLKKYKINSESININENLYAAVITRDKDIVPDSEIL